MKKLIKFAGVACVVTLAQTIQAVPVDNNHLHITSSVVTPPTPTAPVAMVSRARGPSTIIPLLSSIVYQNGTSTGVVSGRNYTPAQIIGHPHPGGPTRRPFSPDPTTNNPVTPVTVADGGTTAGLLGLALFGTALMKRKFGVSEDYRPGFFHARCRLPN